MGTKRRGLTDEYDVLDLLLVLLAAWRRLLLLPLLSALVAGWLAWPVASAPSPRAPVAVVRPGGGLVSVVDHRAVDRAQLEVDELQQIQRRLDPRDAAYWTAREQLRTARERLRTALVPPAPPVPPAPTSPRAGQPWGLRVTAAAAAGLVVAAMSAWVEAWARSKCLDRSWASRRARLAAITRSAPSRRP